MSSSNYFHSWIDRPHLDSNTRLLMEEYQRGITEFMGTSEPQPAVRLEEPIRTDVDYGKKGRLVGLGRRTRSVPPSSAPPPFVDPEVLTAQLKDKDDRISLLETQMAAQQAGYEAQRRLNQQMMEMMQRMYPNEGPLFLGIFRGFISSEFSDENSKKHFVGTSEVNSEDVLPRYIPRRFPANWWSSEFPRNSVGKFRGISEENGISEELFPMTCFVVLLDDVHRSLLVFQIWKTSGLEDFRKSYDGILIPCLPFIIDLSVVVFQIWKTSGLEDFQTTSRKSYDGVFIHIKWSLSLSL
ncbi:hypothetical protein F2Q69_00048911 [Brassica cretica]|uniref:Uncharacterized protein n=1 Tax=Brassica cretica TaxID=69181 RepID=A0A8S9PV61_BRACR|nr:hypothetical protein F2Q69_00048911 [Brassica cretica]